MLNHYKDSMDNYLWRIPHGRFGVETRRIVREERFDKFARVPVARFLLALYFIAKDDAFIRPHKPIPNKPMYYRRGLWKVHNCGQRKDGTFYTSGNAALVIFEDVKVTFDSTMSNLPYSEIKAKYEEVGRRLRNESRSEDLPRKG